MSVLSNINIDLPAVGEIETDGELYNTIVPSGSDNAVMVT